MRSLAAQVLIFLLTRPFFEPIDQIHYLNTELVTRVALINQEILQSTITHHWELRPLKI